MRKSTYLLRHIIKAEVDCSAVFVLELFEDGAGGDFDDSELLGGDGAVDCGEMGLFLAFPANSPFVLKPFCDFFFLVMPVQLTRWPKSSCRPGDSLSNGPWLGWNSIGFFFGLGGKKDIPVLMSDIKTVLPACVRRRYIYIYTTTYSEEFIFTNYFTSYE